VASIGAGWSATIGPDAQPVVCFKVAMAAHALIES
jgi:hypothetical protein